MRTLLASIAVPIFADISADPASGRFHAVWIADGVIPNELRWSWSKDGLYWSAPQTVVRTKTLESTLKICG